MKFKYTTEALDRPVILRDRIVRPGDVYETDEEVVHGQFTPANPAAKAAAAETAKRDAGEPVAEAEPEPEAVIPPESAPEEA